MVHCADLLEDVPKLSSDVRFPLPFEPEFVQRVQLVGYSGLFLLDEVHLSNKMREMVDRNQARRDQTRRQPVSVRHVQYDAYAGLTKVML
jgi:hypothetical protein